MFLYRTIEPRLCIYFQKITIINDIIYIYIINGGTEGGRGNFYRQVHDFHINNCGQLP